MPPTALVQRSRPLGVCERLIEAAGEGGLALLEGTAGMGKSALVDAACAMARERGLTVLRATGSGFERDCPYGVVRQLFDPLVAPVRSRRRPSRPCSAGAAAAVLGLAPDGGEPEHSVRHALLAV